MATYQQIQLYVQSEYGFRVETKWIVEVKQKYGLSTYHTPQLPPKTAPSPFNQEQEEAIIQALRHFNMILIEL